MVASSLREKGNGARNVVRDIGFGSSFLGVSQLWCSRKDGYIEQAK
jgi:hypothetical protein